MATRMLWSLEEAVIMVDYLIKNIHGEIDRKEAIFAASKELRERAIRNGMEIDEIFRNINGITLQMCSVENVLLNEERNLRKPAKVFLEAIELYKKDNSAYLQLLKEARKIPKMKTIQDRFCEWIERKISLSKVTDMFLMVHDIEEFCIDRKILRGKLFETTDLSTIHKVKSIVMSDSMFRKRYKNKIRKMEFLIIQYSHFLKEESKRKETGIEKLSQQIVTVIPESKTENVRNVYSEIKTRTESEGKNPLINVQKEKEKFSIWMQNSGVSNSTTRCYLSALKSLSTYLSDKEGRQVIIYEMDDTKIQELKELLTDNVELRNLNAKFHNHIRAGLNKLILYRLAKESLPEANTSSDKEMCVNNAYIPKIELPDFSRVQQVDIKPEMMRLDKILRNNFSEGLLPNVLRLDKFRMLFEAEFGYEPTSDDTILVQQLKQVGMFMDGRIYPKQDEKQSNLTADIITEIINTLNNGAKCIYLTCVLERWRTELASELNIYNEITLKELLASQNIIGLVLTENVIKATRQKVNSEENVIEVMKESHSFMNYEQLKEKLWFIPVENIKHTLVITPSIVNVDAETYFYAPNFPASTEELQQIKLYMSNKIDEKGYLVASDMYSIIHSNCPTVAINTAGYRDFAYRNIIKYLFQNDFEFGNSVISKKGNTLEMWQVYQGYCQEHEHITLDDLKQLKDELGVTIYWNTVRAEMIRINSDELIRKDRIHFDIEAIDSVLDEMCPGEYIPLKDITMFLHFPPIEYPWNSFVLESYLSISRKFCLFHASYANHGAFGVIVRRNSRLADYRSVVVDMLSHSNEWQTASDALTLIVNKGYQARKKWTGFEKVAQEASLLREQLLEERK